MLIAEHTSHKLAAFNDTLKHVRKEQQLSIVQTSRLKLHRQLTRELSMQTIKHRHQCMHGSSERATGWEFISITRCAVMVGKDGSKGHLWMVITFRQGLCFNTTAATGMDVVDVLPTVETKLSATNKLGKIDILQQ